MNPLLIDYIIISLLVSVQLSNSLNVYALDKKGHIAQLNEPIHINEEQTPKSMRDRFQKQVAEFLISKKENRKSVFKTSKVSQLDSSKPNSSLVVFSNGRYVLDLDKLVIKERNDSVIIENDCEYFDSDECFKDLYESTNDSQESVGLTAEPSSKSDSLRKNNKHSKANQDLSSKEYVVILRHGKNSIMKRFKIINNGKEEWSADTDSSSSSKEVKRKRKNKFKFSSERDSSISSREVQDSLSKEETKFSSKESPEEDEDEVYLQGNQLIPLKRKNHYKNTKRTRPKNLGGRRRLPHFMPKRYHWDSDDIKNLGYFWFNGPRGRYPEAVAL